MSSIIDLSQNFDYDTRVDRNSIINLLKIISACEPCISLNGSVVVDILSSTDITNPIYLNISHVSDVINSLRLFGDIEYDNISNMITFKGSLPYFNDQQIYLSNYIAPPIDVFQLKMYFNIGGNMIITTTTEPFNDRDSTDILLRRVFEKKFTLTCATNEIDCVNLLIHLHRYLEDGWVFDPNPFETIYRFSELDTTEVNNRCPICDRDFISTDQVYAHRISQIYLPCIYHVTHLSCIAGWFKTRLTDTECPMCHDNISIE